MDELIVEYNGTKVRINSLLLDRQDCWDNLILIKQLHYERMMIEEMMERTDIDFELEYFYGFWTENQFELQDAWGFPRNSKFHRGWTVPKCTCPKLDNEDSYPYQFYVNLDCPIHGV